MLLVLCGGRQLSRFGCSCAPPHRPPKRQQALGKLTTLTCLKLDETHIRAVYSYDAELRAALWTEAVVAPLAALTQLRSLQLPRMHRDPGLLAFVCATFTGLTSLKFSLPRLSPRLSLGAAAGLQVRWPGLVVVSNCCLIESWCHWV